MATATKVTYVVDATKVEVQTKAETAPNENDAEWAVPAEIEEIGVEVENSTETWTPFGQDGWQSSLLTGKGVKITVKGKRVIGDAGNDAIADRQFKVGADAYINIRFTDPDGSKMQFTCVCDVKKCGASGKATDVAPLEAELTSHGKPVITDAPTE